MADVRFDGVRKVYDNGRVAVHGASFDIADGELMVLVGPSGCGKSTLLRMVAGLEETSAGTLSIGGRVVNDVAPKDRDIAMVFQNYALYPHMTVAENLAFGLKLRGHDKAEIARRVQGAADMLGLGRALVREPAVFLLDEPLSNLDAKLRHSVRTEIAHLHRKLGTTMIYVTHDQVEAMTLGQRIVVLNDGMVQQIDTPMALYQRPANLFVAGFLGSPAMNTLKGRLQALADGHFELDMGQEGRVPLGRAPLPGAWSGREVVVGVRPEHLQPGTGEAAFGVLIDSIEPVGNEMFVNLRHAGRALVMRVPPQALPAAGEGIDVAVVSAALHFFDVASGLRLDAAQAA